MEAFELGELGQGGARAATLDQGRELFLVERGQVFGGQTTRSIQGQTALEEADGELYIVEVTGGLGGDNEGLARAREAARGLAGDGERGAQVGLLVVIVAK